jgi:hypothetical protein
MRIRSGEVTTSPSGPSIRKRLDEFYRRLQAAPAVTAAEAALEQICRMLDEVEDELSGIPKKSPPPPLEQSDGRMYPPYEDSVTRRPDGGIVATTRGHVIEIGGNGSLLIRSKRTGNVEFRK